MPNKMDPQDLMQLIEMLTMQGGGGTAQGPPDPSWMGGGPTDASVIGAKPNAMMGQTGGMGASPFTPGPDWQGQPGNMQPGDGPGMGSAGPMAPVGPGVGGNPMMAGGPGGPGPVQPPGGFQNDMGFSLPNRGGGGPVAHPALPPDELARNAAGDFSGRGANALDGSVPPPGGPPSLKSLLNTPKKRFKY